MTSEEQYLYLTTIGWKSGNPHEIEIWFVQVGECYYLVSEKLTCAHWVQNIQRNPAIQVRVGEHQFEGVGRLIPTEVDAELEADIKELMDAKYGWSAGLVVELCAGV